MLTGFCILHFGSELNIHLVCKKVLSYYNIFMAVIVGVGVSVGIFIAKFDRKYVGNDLYQQFIQYQYL